MSQLSLKENLAQKILPSVRPAFVGDYLKWLLGIRRTVIETELGKFFVDPVSRLGVELVQNGVYEASMIRTLREHLPKAGTFIGIGANEGFFSVLGSQLVGAEGRVIAVEPQSRLHPVIDKNLSLNDIENVDTRQVAISDREGSETLHLTPEVNSGASGFRRDTWYQFETETVPTVKLADFLAREDIHQIDVMKVDIEGAEYEAIMGSPEVFEERRVNTLALELHPLRLQDRGLEPKELIDFVEGCGYQRDDRFRNTVWTCA